MQCSSQHTIEIEIFSETDWLNAFKILYVCLHNILRERFLGNMIQFSSAFSHKYLVTEIIIKAPNVSLILDTSRPSIRRPWHDTWTIPHNEPKPKPRKMQERSLLHLSSRRWCGVAIKAKRVEIRNERRTARVPEWLNNTLCELQFNMLIFHNAHRLQSLKRHTIDFLLFLRPILFAFMYVVAQQRALFFMSRTAKLGWIELV